MIKICLPCGEIWNAMLQGLLLLNCSDRNNIILLGSSRWLTLLCCVAQAPWICLSLARKRGASVNGKRTI
jgi:hypothetical protein